MSYKRGYHSIKIKFFSEANSKQGLKEVPQYHKKVVIYTYMYIGVEIKDVYTI